MTVHTTAVIMAAFISMLVLSPMMITTVSAHNITHILNNFRDFSTFNHYLTITHLANEINNRQTITVCAVNNAVMSHLLQKHLSIPTIKNILSLHVLLDYFGAKKLHQITSRTTLAATLFQATGSATDSSGLVNITDLKGGKVVFSTEDSDKTDARFVKSLQEIKYNISVIQISNILPSAEAQAPVAEPADVNITLMMSAHGCKSFADALVASDDAMKTYVDNVETGLTVFCPLDGSFKRFLTKYKNLTVSEKQSLLEYHGVPIYESKTMLRSSNGLMNTLATDGGNKYDFTVQNDGQDVTVKTGVNVGKIVGTLIDQQPLVIFTVDKVLLPKELFKAAVSPAPAPKTDGLKPDSPKVWKDKEKKKGGAPSDMDSAEAPADSPDDYPADQEVDSDGVEKIKGFRFAALVLSFWFAYLLVI